MITFIRDNKFALWRIDDLEGKGYYGTCESYEGGQLMVQAKTRSDFFDQIERLCATRERKLSRDDAGPIVGSWSLKLKIAFFGFEASGMARCDRVFRVWPSVGERSWHAAIVFFAAGLTIENQATRRRARGRVDPAS